MGIFDSIKKAITKVPVVGRPLASVYGVTVAPAALAENIVRGQRVDRAVVGALKANIQDAKTLAPYAQTVVSFVPGVGQGAAGIIGAASALADGHPITEAVLEGVAGAVPGGPLAKSAFKAAVAVATGKSLDAAALQALPLPDQQKRALTLALSSAAKLARGERVDDTLLNTALEQLPPDLAKAVKVGAAVGSAAKIQQTGNVAAKKVDTVLRAVNSSDPAQKRAALQAVKTAEAKAKAGDKQAAGMLTMLGRHAAAERVRRRFRVHGKTGIVFRVTAAKAAG